MSVNVYILELMDVCLVHLFKYICIRCGLQLSSSNTVGLLKLSEPQFLTCKVRVLPTL